MTENNNVKKNSPNWEKIGVYFACLSLGISLFSFLVSQQIQLADLRERTKATEVKIENLEKNDR